MSNSMTIKDMKVVDLLKLLGIGKGDIICLDGSTQITDENGVFSMTFAGSLEITRKGAIMKANYIDDVAESLELTGENKAAFVKALELLIENPTMMYRKKGFSYADMEALFRINGYEFNPDFRKTLGEIVHEKNAGTSLKEFMTEAAQKWLEME